MKNIVAPKVLVVDDYNDTRQIVKWMLEQRNYRVIEAADGQEAVEIAMQERPDVILMDLDMPVLDGFNAIRRTREHDDLSHIPIVAVTAHDMAQARDKAQMAGCDYYISKPIDFQRLFVLIERLLGQQEPRS